MLAFGEALVLARSSLIPDWQRESVGSILVLGLSTCGLLWGGVITSQALWYELTAFPLPS